MNVIAPAPDNRPARPIVPTLDAGFPDHTAPEMSGERGNAGTPEAMDRREPAIQPGSVKTPPKPAFELFASFPLGGEEFALPAASVQEVVGYPESMATVPLGPPYLAGIFRLRDHIIPVIDLARLFDPSASAAPRSGKVAIVIHDDILVGLLFEDTGEILRIRPDEHSMLHYDATCETGVIAGTIRLSREGRLLRVLHPPGIIRIDNIPQVKASLVARAGLRHPALRCHAERRPVVAFHAGKATFAFDVSAIQEIIAVPPIQKSVLASKLCIGRFTFRGNAVGVIDLAQLLDLARPDAGLSSEQRLIVIRIGTGFLGLLVDSVDSIFSIAPSEVLPIPLLSSTRAGMIRGCIQQSEREHILLLDHGAIFTETELRQITKGHADLYQQEAPSGTRQASKDRMVRRQVFVAFTLDQHFAVAISRIREILPLCDAVLHPPGLPPFVHGVLSLRQKMVTLIDLRLLYALPPSNSPTDRKILILERGDELFGLLVDSVDSLIAVSDSHRKPAPGIVRGRQASSDIMTAMQEIIDMELDDGSRQTYGIFEAGAFLEKLTRTAEAA